MHSLRHRSKHAKTAFVLLGFVVAILLTLAARPVAGLAAPSEPAEPPQLVFEPDHHDFGLQPLNWGSQQATFQLRNAGAEAFQIGSPQISGSGSNAFWTGNSNCYGAFLHRAKLATRRSISALTKPLNTALSSASTWTPTCSAPI